MAGRKARKSAPKLSVFAASLQKSARGKSSKLRKRALSARCDPNALHKRIHLQIESESKRKFFAHNLEPALQRVVAQHATPQNHLESLVQELHNKHEVSALKSFVSLFALLQQSKPLSCDLAPHLLPLLAAKAPESSAVFLSYSAQCVQLLVDALAERPRTPDNALADAFLSFFRTSFAYAAFESQRVAIATLAGYLAATPLQVDVAHLQQLSDVLRSVGLQKVTFDAAASNRREAEKADFNQLLLACEVRLFACSYELATQRRAPALDARAVLELSARSLAQQLGGDAAHENTAQQRQTPQDARKDGFLIRSEAAAKPRALLVKVALQGCRVVRAEHAVQLCYLLLTVLAHAAAAHMCFVKQNLLRAYTLPALFASDALSDAEVSLPGGPVGALEDAVLFQLFASCCAADVQLQPAEAAFCEQLLLVAGAALLDYFANTGSGLASKLKAVAARRERQSSIANTALAGTAPRAARRRGFATYLLHVANALQSGKLQPADALPLDASAWLRALHAEAQRAPVHSTPDTEAAVAPPPRAPRYVNVFSALA